MRPFVLPTLTELDGASRLLAATSLLYGAQDCHWEPVGAFTGAVSPRTIAELGCTLLEIGHAERLRWFGESWEVACRKAAAAAGAGLVPLVCVGEASTTTNAHAAEEVEAQLGAVLEAVGESPLLVAYEPCWAIGAEAAAASDHVGFVVERIRTRLGSRPTESAVLYGGSVSPASVDELMQAPIDGVFVGRAATRVEGFVEIAARMAQAWPGHPRSPAPASR